MSTLSKLEFLDCAMKETVRSYAMLYLTRRVITPVTIGSHEIPKEEIVAVSPYYVHHDAANYADPDTYDPERFAGSAGLKHVEDKTYIQFGYGPHRCLGEKFANIVLKTGWLEIFSNYNVDILTPIPQADLTRYAFAFILQRIILD
jgi:cytochrome P450